MKRLASPLSRQLTSHLKIPRRPNMPVINLNPGNPVDDGSHPSGLKLINLIRGWPSPDLLPTPLLLSAANVALTDPSIFVPALQYGEDLGYRPLREQIALWLSSKYGVEPDVERICVTGGASQNIACVMQGFADPAYTRAVWVVAPTYFLAGPIFEDSGFYGADGRLRGFGEDVEGPDVEELEREIRKMEEEQGGSSEPVYKHPSPQRKIYRHIIYLVPTCANPSGVTMSLARRRALVDLARRHDALVICDDVYDLLQWPVLTAAPTTSSSSPSLPLPPTTPLPRLVDIDLPLGPSPHDPEGSRFGHVLSNGTFSKLIAPGLRTGWVEAAPALAYGVAQTGSTRSGGAPSQLAAALVTQMLKAGQVDAHVGDRVRPALQRRHGRILRTIRDEMAGLGVEVRTEGEVGGGVAGGYFVWVTLPDGLAGKEVTRRAREEENLVVAEGEMFEVRGDEGSPRFPGNLRLCFSWEKEEDVVEGVKRLGRVVRRMLEGGEEVQGTEERGGDVGDAAKWV